MHPDTDFHAAMKAAKLWNEFAQLEWPTRVLVITIVRGLCLGALIERDHAIRRAHEAVAELTGSPRLAEIARATVAKWTEQPAVAAPTLSDAQADGPVEGGLLPMIRVNGIVYVVAGCVHLWPGPDYPPLNQR